jgi:antitoxin StbD
MQTLYAETTVSLSEFKKNPATVLRRANHRPVAVLNENGAAFYVIDPTLMDVLVEALTDEEWRNLVRARLQDGSKPVEVELGDL